MQIKKNLILADEKGNKFFLVIMIFLMRAAFCSAKSPLERLQAKIKKKKDKIIITFQSKSFLQKNVRSMVGCLKYVGEYKCSQKIKSVLN